jgi:DNA-binding transcriptional MerR regulator
MKIGLIAEKTGVSRDAIRLYEKIGLLGDVNRPFEYNNYKDYGPENIYRINMVKEMQKIGLTLRECRGVIDSLVNDEMNSEKRIDFVKGKILDVNSKIKALKKIKGFLQAHLDNDCAFNSDSMIAKLKAK